MTHVTTIVRNPADPKRTYEALFLVDKGAFDCLIPANRLREIGLAPRGKRSYELADGTQVKLEITTAQVEFMSETVGSTLILGPEGAEPIPAVTALESAGFEVDPRSQQLKRLPAVRLK